MEFHEKLKKLSQHYGLNANALAKKMNYERTDVIYKIFEGKTKNPSVEFVMKLKEAFPEIDANYFVSDNYENMFLEKSSKIDSNGNTYLVADLDFWLKLNWNRKEVKQHFHTVKNVDVLFIGQFIEINKEEIMGNYSTFSAVSIPISDADIIPKDVKYIYFSKEFKNDVYNWRETQFRTVSNKVFAWCKAKLAVNIHFSNRIEESVFSDLKESISNFRDFAKSNVSLERTSFYYYDFTPNDEYSMQAIENGACRFFNWIDRISFDEFANSLPTRNEAIELQNLFTHKWYGAYDLIELQYFNSCKFAQNMIGFYEYLFRGFEVDDFYKPVIKQIGKYGLVRKDKQKKSNIKKKQ